MKSWWTVTLIIVLSLAAVSTLGIWWYRRVKKPDDPMAPAKFTVPMGLLGVLMGVVLNNVIASKVAYDNRQQSPSASVQSPPPRTSAATPRSESDPAALAAREKHLSDLRQVLEGDDRQFKNLAGRLKDDGVVVEPESPKEQEEAEVKDRFQDESPLSFDLANHFESYAVRRSKLRGAVHAYTANLRKLYAKVNEQFTVLDKLSGRQQAALGAVKQCTGRAPNVFLRGDARSYWFGLGNQGGNGPAPPPPEIVACVRAFEAFKMTPDVEAACKRLRLESEKVSGIARMLASEAKDLTFRTSLSGNCRYLKVE